MLMEIVTAIKMPETATLKSFLDFGVLDETTGKPVAEFTAHLIPAGGTGVTTNRPREVTFREPSGRFQLEELAGGNYELTITANGYLALTAPVAVKPAEPANAGPLKLSAGHSAGVSSLTSRASRLRIAAWRCPGKQPPKERSRAASSPARMENA